MPRYGWLRLRRRHAQEGGRTDLSERVFQARLAEYTSARDEMLCAISNQHLVLTFGSASIVGLFVAGFVVWSQSFAPAIFFALPLLSLWTLLMWTAEVVRMLRAVEFCGTQADILNRSLPETAHDKTPLRWEAWRRLESYRTITWTYISIPIANFLVWAMALTSGFIVAGSKWPTWIIAIAGFYTLLGIALVLWMGHTFRRWTLAPNPGGVGMPGRSS